MNEQKSFLLRLPKPLLEAYQKWAEDELRSLVPRGCVSLVANLGFGSGECPVLFDRDCELPFCLF
jgi:hypothetical protein